ncbi:MAG TPA: hypothetical protein VH590_10625, partial [Ktedonobacterales bacterium]
MELSSQIQRVFDASAKRAGLGKTLARWVLLLALALAVAFVGAELVLHTTPGDLEPLLLYLLASGVASALLGVGALLLLRFVPGMSLRLKMALPPLVAAIVMALNVYVTARLMF